MAVKILTVDDSKTIRMIVAKAFRPYECEVLEASNGVEGLAVASKEKPNVIILDVTMPVMDGPEMLAKLKSNPDLRSIPVVMLTAEAGKENVLRIAKMGVRDYLVKPFKEELIVERVGRIVELKPRGDSAQKHRRIDEEIKVLVVDDKPAIIDHIKKGLSDLPWHIEGVGQINQAFDYAQQNVVDVILISLSLPSDAGFVLYQKFKGTVKTRNTPILGMCVKIANEEQTRAQQLGFTGIVTKPIDIVDLRSKIVRALNLDTSFLYFEHRDTSLVVKIPVEMSQAVIREIESCLQQETTKAVDAGLDKVILDLTKVTVVDINLVELGLAIRQVSQDLSLKFAVLGSAEIQTQCRNFQETKDWKLAESFEKAMEILK